MPATAALAARGERGRLRALYLRSTRWLLVLYGGVTLALLGLGAPLVRLWMGPDFAQSWVVMAFLVVGSLVQSQNVVAHVMLPGMRELRVFTRFMAVYPVVTAVCAVSGILLGGLVGLAAGTALSMLVMETAFLLVIVRTRFDLPVRRVLARCHLPAAKALLPVALWLGLVRLLVDVRTWGELFAAGVIAGLVFLTSTWQLALTRAERRAVRDRLVRRTSEPIEASVPC
jgi:O-antigen/teichoic acid export membrane protein